MDFLLKSSKQLDEVGTVVKPFSDGELKTQNDEDLAQGHPASEWQSWDSNLDSLTPRPKL